MKKQITFIGVALAIFGLCASVKAQVDLTMKEGIYFTGTKNSINAISDKYAAKNTRVDVFADQAARFEGGHYVFNLGIIGIRTGFIYTQLHTFGQFFVPGLGTTGNSMIFPATRKGSRLVVPVKLQSGGNRVTFTIDPFKERAESDETNNTFWVDVVVNQRFPSAGPTN